MESLILGLCFINAVRAIYKREWMGMCGWLAGAIGWAMVIMIGG